MRHETWDPRINLFHRGGRYRHPAFAKASAWQCPAKASLHFEPQGRRSPQNGHGTFSIIAVAVAIQPGK